VERLYKKSSIMVPLLVICHTLSSVTVAQTPDWYTKMKQIRVFQSTRQEVEALFKFSNKKETPGNGWVKDVYYDIEGARLSVGYSTGGCGEHPSSGYNLDRNVVIRIAVYSMKDIRMSNFDFDLRRFESYKESDNNAIIWKNYDFGIQVEGGVTQNGVKLVKSIDFSATNLEKDKFDCANKV
jgi:hypothetical protein